MSRLYLAILVALMHSGGRKKTRRAWQRRRNTARREQRLHRERVRMAAMEPAQ